ncbi:MAG: glycine hydroxymethyltransferase [Chlamydiales bacterium]|nr:glycine hydroxymethyltransferase [Chlamydiales bacterium]
MNFLKDYLHHTPLTEINEGAVAYLASLDVVGQTYPQVTLAIINEIKDQRSHLKMIASENYSSLAVQLAMGNLLTDKYSEGFPFHRFYAGCENVDTIEDLAVKELKHLFGAQHAYVQPHSGADANLVAYWSILVKRVQLKELEQFADKSIDELSHEDYEKIRKKLVNQKVLGMSLNSGGHLTHGYRHNVSAKMMEAINYDINTTTQRIDYAEIEAIAKRERPLILVAGYSAYPRLINFAKMKEIADRVGAVLMVDMAHFAGLVAGKVMQGEFDPVPYADIVTSTTHKTLRGPRGGLILCKEEFKDVVNKGCPLVLGGPLPHVMAAKAVSFKEANQVSFQEYALQIVKNAKALAEYFLSKGIKLFTDGTDNHLMVVNVQQSFGLNGRQAENALRESGITANRNTIPFDPNGPWYTSGIRLGTPALTTLGMKEKEMKIIGEIIINILSKTEPVMNEKTGGLSKATVKVDHKILEKARSQVSELLEDYPLYPEIRINVMESAKC